MAATAQAVQIVRLDKSSKGLELNLEALAEICLNEKCRDKPLCVVSIAGDFRKGKSFMLNFFLRYLYHMQRASQKAVDGQDKASDAQTSSDWLGNPHEELEGFSWRGGSKPETTGILVWSDPIVVKNCKGQELAVLLMDTQGAFDSRQTMGQTAIIFALSTLTSSIQIYNIMNNIQEDNLQILDTFLGYGQLVLDNSAETPFQELCFLVRDWRSPNDFSYGAEGGKLLLKEKLAIDQDDPTSQDNQTRRRIENCFEKKSCFLMPYPGERVSVEEGGPFKGQISEMKPNFVEHLRTFVPSVLDPASLMVKRIGGQEVTGQSLYEYFKVYANTFTQEKIPEAKTLYVATAEASNLAAVANSRNTYLSSMKEICGANKPYVNLEILQQKHDQLLRESLVTFDTTKKLGDADFVQSFRDNLKSEMLSSFKEFCEANDNKKMFNIWGSTMIMLIFWFIAFTLGRIFSFIGISPLANLFYLQGNVALFGALFYWGTKYNGRFPEVVEAVDRVAEQVWHHVSDMFILSVSHLATRAQAR